MKPFLAKGYAKRKLHTGNQSVQFDEEISDKKSHHKLQNMLPHPFGAILL